MSLSWRELLELGKGPEDREEIMASIERVMEMRDEDIDCSDIPNMADAAGWRPAKPILDEMRRKGRTIDAKERGLPCPDALIERGMRGLADGLGPSGAEMFLDIIIEDRLAYATWARDHSRLATTA